MKTYHLVVHTAKGVTLRTVLDNIGTDQQHDELAMQIIENIEGGGVLSFIDGDGHLSIVPADAIDHVRIVQVPS